MSRADIVRAYLKAIEKRGDSLAYFTEDAVQEEFPNALVPAGARRTIADLREANARGRGVLTSESYEIVSLLENGDLVACEVRIPAWTGSGRTPCRCAPSSPAIR